MADTKLRKRSEISEEYKWKLEDMYATDELWEEEADKLEKLGEEIAQFKGKLSESADTLLAFMKKKDEISYYSGRVIVYSNQKSHQDTAVTKYQGYVAKAESVVVGVRSAMAFADPEILNISEDVIEQFYKDEPELLKYKRVIDEIQRRKAHTLSEAEEKILAAAGEVTSAPDNIFSMFNNADIKFPYITDVEGNKIQITHGNYIDFLLSTDKSLRKQAFQGVQNTYKKWSNTLAATYIAQLKNDNFYAKIRKYDSPRAMYLADGNIPESVYDNLIETVHAHLPALHKYMSIRKKMLGVERLHMYDLFVPIVDNADTRYTYEEAKELVVKALAPMGEEYISALKEGMESGWIDVYENENKRSGAYSWGAYGTHPYVLLNHVDNLDSVFTLAHEMGHAMHTYYSNQTQPITYSDYLIFVAEVASTCNESLLMHYMLENCNDENERKYLTCHYLDSFRTTLFRQAQFAEFEHIAHQKIADGETLTKEDLCQIWYDLNVLYYGPDMTVDEEIKYEWMRIPHFYTPYYVYQYSTGYSAAVAFSKKILDEGQPAVDTYIKNFLCGGSSKDPIDLLKGAGVDMSSPEPVDAALKVFEEYLDKFEQA